MNQRLQAPVHYAVQTSPTRAGSYPGPYTIINPSANASTVWVADNAGLQINQGTPVFPGTSLTWDKSGDLWAVAEGPGTQIIISYDVSDWEPNPAAIAVAILNSGVLVVDNPQILFNGVLNAGNSYQTDLIDISRYQSLSIEAIVSVLSAGNSDTLTIEFLDGTNPQSLNSKTIQFSATGTVSGTGNGGIWTGTIAAESKFVRFISNSSTQFVLNIVGSHRPQETLSQIISNNNAGQLPIDFYFETLSTPQAATTNVLLPPWFGEIDVQIYGSWAAAPGATIQTSCRLQFRDPATGVYVPVNVFQIPSTVFLGSASGQAAKRFSLSGHAARLQILNNTTSGGTFTYQLSVVPVSGFSSIA